MACKSISAILWTLVSVNVLTLVIGGLITWLGYAIPVRLKQFGLLPELVIIAGFASLVVACMGLCALNYSSHHALNIYGFSCATFALLLLIGLPETWRVDRTSHQGGLALNVIYFALLFLLLLLLAFAFTLAQYLRRKEMADEARNLSGQPNGTDCPSAECTCASLAFTSSPAPPATTTTNTSQLDAANVANEGQCVCRQPDSYQQLYQGCPQCVHTGNHLASNHFQRMPLVRKGIYTQLAPQSELRRTRSSHRPLDLADEWTADDKQIELDYQRQPALLSDIRFAALTNQATLNRSDQRLDWLARSASNLSALFARDDLSVQQHDNDCESADEQLELQHRQPTNRGHHHGQRRSPTQNSPNNQWLTAQSRCRCHLGSVGPLVAKLRALPMVNSNHPGELRSSLRVQSQQSCTLPNRLNSLSHYAIARNTKHKTRTKGSSSVMAMTAAAAATLLGGAANIGGFDTTSDGGMDDGQLNDAYTGENNQMECHNNCDLDNSDLPLDVSMLASVPTNAFATNSGAFIQTNPSRESASDVA